ncbi:MAG: hypothetical protein QNI84_11565 [Henriciella sp.]|nr:hypothetical protein [Henriciella sp.]
MRIFKSTGLAIGLILGLGGFSAAQVQPSSFGIDRDTGEIICTDDGDAALSDDPSYRAAALWDQMMLADRPDLCGPDLTPIDGGTWGESRKFDGLDAQGKSAEFRLYVLHDRYSWSSGSSRQIEDNGQFVRFSEVLETPQFFQRFCASKAAMAFGSTSSDGATATNHQLARARATTLGEALSGARGACAAGQIPIMFSINLGEYRADAVCAPGASCPASAAEQRRVIIVAVEALDIGVNLREALRAALTQPSILKTVDLRQFDLFEVEQN